MLNSPGIQDKSRQDGWYSMQKAIVWIFLAALLGACGGGGSSRVAEPSPTLPSLSIGDAAATEGDNGTSSLNLVVTLSAASTSAVTIEFATSDSSAIANSDYTANSGTLSLAAGATTATITIDIVGDSDTESTEQFFVTLSNPTNATLANGQATISINDNDAGLVGLAVRPSNTSCLAPSRTTANGILTLEDAFPNLPNLSLPMKIIQARNDTTQFYAVSRQGGLDRFNNSPTANSVQRYLDLVVTADGEGGFLSAAMHPNWPTTKEIYVSYTINSGGFESRLSRLVITNDTNLPATYVEEILLQVDQPATNHNGGDIEFGNDGYLYYSMGDGGGSGDPSNNGQTTSTLLGNILRLDVLGVAFPSPGYNLPSDNPFSANSKCGPATNANACPEIFAWGFRNPWRMSFDQATGALWAADVGQGAREEVDIVTLGNNYGWRCREGTIAFNTTGCATSGFTEPVHDYDRSAGDLSITGGYVYRGSLVPQLTGKYIFADYVSGRVWSLENQGGTYIREELIDNSFSVAGLSQSNDGEVYVLNLRSGRIFRFVADGGISIDNVPDDLAATGCVSTSDPKLPSSGMIPYQAVAPFWSDGAAKERWVGLPNGATINPIDPMDWQFPTGTVISKNFSLNNQLIETRLFMRHPDGAWAGYTFQWNDAETSATRVRNGANRVVGAQTWIYPSEGECLTCHTSQAGFVLGLETAQVNSEHFYTSTGISDNQLEVFNHINLFTNDVAEPVSLLPALVDPMDNNAPLQERARAYLHTNCAGCHLPGGPTGVDLDLRYSTSLAATGTCNQPPQAGDLGIANAQLIAPGDSSRSVLIERTNRRDADAMPPLSSNQVDTDGVELLREWVNSLTACP